jgi:phenylacetate-CoA ligase
MPLLRYQVGDVGRLLTEPSATGHNTPRLRVMGRVREALVIDGRFITASEVYDALDPVPGLDFFQLVERAPGRLELRLVPSHENADPSADAVAVLQGLVGDGAVIEPRLVKSLRPEDSGKFVFVKALDRDAEPRDA